MCSCVHVVHVFMWFICVHAVHVFMWFMSSCGSCVHVVHVTCGSCVHVVKVFVTVAHFYFFFLAQVFQHGQESCRS